MKKTTLITLVATLLFGFAAQPQDTTDIPTKPDRMNFFVISRPTKIDPPTYFNIMRTKVKCLFKRKKFHAVVARSSQEMQAKVEKKLLRRNAKIGSLWFDSHGSFKKGYSFFTVGNDQFSYKNIRDSAATASFQKLANYCDSNSRIGIGSCYGGATYSRPASEKLAASRMNGDSLMMGMANIFRGSAIYACESWVMTKPGLFNERFAMAGYPLRKKFKDEVYKPVWEQLGVWNVYSTSTSVIARVNCVMLDRSGNIRTRFNAYQSKPKVKKQIARNIGKLKANLMKV